MYSYKWEFLFYHKKAIKSNIQNDLCLNVIHVKFLKEMLIRFSAQDVDNNPY